MSKIALQVDHVTKSFPVHKYNKNIQQTLRRWLNRSSRERYPVLCELSFTIHHGEKVALVGRNGSGKTTLLRLLAGIYGLDSGSIRVDGQPCILFDSNVGTTPLLSTQENVFLFAALHEIDRACIAPRLDEILGLAGLEAHRHTPFRDLSKGQRQRFALAVFLQTQARIVMLDEALANLDIGFVQQCDQYLAALKASDKTVVMTLHDSAFLRRHCDRALWLEKGRIEMDGDINTVINAYERSFT